MSSEQLEVIIGLLKAGRANPPAAIAEMRSGFEQMASTFPLDPQTRCEPVDAGSVKSEWISVDDADPSRAVLYLHGGGYVIGSLKTHRAFASWLSKACGARVLLIDYRLAPEHPHPAAVDDAVEAFRWMLKQGIAPSSIGIGGDSAGGGLAVAALVALRDAELPLPGAGICLSPWIDLEALGASMTTLAELDPLVQKDGLLEMGRLYLNGQNPRTPLAAPLYADLRGLPPLLIQVGSAETLLDDSIRLADHARKAGVEVELECWENMIHVWHMFAPALDEGRQAIHKLGAFIRNRLK